MLDDSVISTDGRAAEERRRVEKFPSKEEAG